MKTFILTIVAVSLLGAVQAQDRRKQVDEKNYRIENIHNAKGEKIGHWEVSEDGKTAVEYDHRGERIGRSEQHQEIPARMMVYDTRNNPVGWTEKDSANVDVIHRYDMDGKRIGEYRKVPGKDRYDYHEIGSTTEY